MFTRGQDSLFSQRKEITGQQTMAHWGFTLATLGLVGWTMLRPAAMFFASTSSTSPFSAKHSMSAVA